jgi:hypothetical protein
MGHADAAADARAEEGPLIFGGCLLDAFRRA